MEIIICDDQQDEIVKIKGICQLFGIEESQIHGYTSSKELIEYIMEEHPDIDLFVLDIEMPDMTGLELKNGIANLYADTNIVFLTSHQEMMQEAFGKQVRGFLQKNKDEEKLFLIIEEIQREKDREDEIIVHDSGKDITLKKSNIVKIFAQHIYTNVEILYCSNNDKSNVITQVESFRISLSKWEELLSDDSFYRVGRNYIVNLSFVRRIADNIILETGEELQVPVRKLREVKMAYNRFCASVMRSVW